jgi:hypothetical protein
VLKTNVAFGVKNGLWSNDRFWRKAAVHEAAGFLCSARIPAGPSTSFSYACATLLVADDTVVG